MANYYCSAANATTAFESGAHAVQWWIGAAAGPDGFGRQVSMGVLKAVHGP